MNFSNILSNFVPLGQTSSQGQYDILSGTSASVGPLWTNVVSQQSPTIQCLYYGRYFCLGDMLIQYIDLSNGNYPATGQASNLGWTMYYPYPYDTTPYTVMLTPFNPAGNNNNIVTTITSINNTSFVFHIGNQAGCVAFLAIGPRPKSLYNTALYKSISNTNGMISPYTHTYNIPTSVSNGQITYNCYTLNTYYGLIFDCSGNNTANITIAFPSTLYNVNMLVVGGGGCGGNGYTDNANTYTCGGAGGGGGMSQLSGYTINYGTQLSITVGQGAINGSTNSGTSSISTITNGVSTVLLSATGGANGQTSSTPTSSDIPYPNGGLGGTYAGGTTNANGGGGTVIDSSYTVGEGGYYFSQSGTAYANASGYSGAAPSSNPSTLIPFYYNGSNTNVSGTTIYYGCSGGGGSLYYFNNSLSSGNGGAAGTNTGGSAGITTGVESSNGGSSTSSLSNGYYGGGGGGGGIYMQEGQSGFFAGTGGNGGNGVVMIWWQIATPSSTVITAT